MEYEAKPKDGTASPSKSSTKAGSVSAAGKPDDVVRGEVGSEGGDEKSLLGAAGRKKRPPVRKPNRVRESRIESMMSKAELARRANLSVLTIDRVEKGYGCRMHTKRKILEALGLSLADRVRVFGEEEG